MAGSWTPPTSAWTSVINGLINDTGTGSDDLWCAAKDNMRLCDVMCPGVAVVLPGAGAGRCLVDDEMGNHSRPPRWIRRVGAEA